MDLTDASNFHGWGGAYQGKLEAGKSSLDTPHFVLACLQGSWLSAFNGRFMAGLICFLGRDKEEKSEGGADKLHPWKCSSLGPVGFEQLVLVEGVPIHGRGVGMDGL